MTPKQKIEFRQSQIRKKVAELTALDEPTDEQRAETRSLTGEFQSNEERLQAIILTSPEPETETVEQRFSDDGQSKEVRELREAVSIADYAAAALEQRAAQGAAADLNAALGVPGNYFPLSVLAPEVEERASVDGNPANRPQPWVNRVFNDAAARRLGVTFKGVPAGQASVPVLTAGQSGAQRGREEATSADSYTISIATLQPTRNAASLQFSIEDAARMPGLEAALATDLRGAVAESVDEAIFKGDATADENVADITGFQTGGITEATITQANKVLAAGVMATLAAMVDGKYAVTPADLRIVASAGSNALWLSNPALAGVAETISEVMRANGFSWTVRGGIDTATANGDFGAYVGRSRGIEGAAVAAVWEQGQLIRDIYSDAKKGEVTLSLNYLWDFAIARTANFQRVKYVT